jgi:hypothetical protein
MGKRGIWKPSKKWSPGKGSERAVRKREVDKGIANRRAKAVGKSR